MKYAPPKSMKLDEEGDPIKATMIDDKTKAPLYQRTDDNIQALTKRLTRYRHEESRILEYYRPFGIVRTVDASKHTAFVKESVMEVINKDAERNAKIKMPGFPQAFFGGEFTAMDGDGDGVLSKEEFIKAGIKGFELVDVDGDGEVTMEEWNEAVAKGLVGT